MPDSGIAFQIGSITIRWYGLLIASGIALGFFLTYKEAKRQHLNTDELANILLLILPIGIIGARLYYVACNMGYYGQHPWQIFQIWRGGLAIHGAIIAAVLTGILYAWGKKLNFFRWADLLIPAVSLAQAIGRWGNFFNQEAYGYPTTVPWAMYIAGAYRHPTFLYESIWDIVVFIILYKLLHREHKIGSVFASYLILYSIGRFFIEMLRTDSLMFGPFRAAMLISGIGVLVGVFILSRIRKNPVVDVAKIQPAPIAVMPKRKKTNKTTKTDYMKKRG